MHLARPLAAIAGKHCRYTGWCSEGRGIDLPVLECSRCNELYYSAHGSTELSCDACGCPIWRVFEDEVSFARVSGMPRQLQPGDHAALLYTEETEAADFCAGYLREGLERGERLIVAMPDELRDDVLSRLPSGQAEQALVLDVHRMYGPDFDPDATASDYADLTKAQDGHVRLLCGPDPAEAAAMDIDDWRRFERTAHELALDLKATALCVYDGRGLPIAFAPVAVETHPLISRGAGELRRNSHFKYETGRA
jgi:MEDS: MEthanogen/methylotroph, DcmR Sensory domain